MGAGDRVRWQFAECEVAAKITFTACPCPGAEIAALCDVDESVLNQRLGDIEKLGLAKPKS